MNINVIRPTWSKVLADLLSDKTRTFLVIASIWVGVFAIGVIITTFAILTEDLGISYASAQPANIEILTDPFDKDLIKSIEKVPGVSAVEGRQLLSLRVGQGEGSWKPIELVAIKNPSMAEMNLLTLVNGTKYPQNRELVVRDDMMNNTGLQPGDQALIQLTDGTVREMPVVGTVGDQYSAGSFSAPPRGYITLETAEWLGGPENFNRLYVQVDDGDNEAAIAATAKRVEDKIERSGANVYRTNTNRTDEHPMESTVLALLGVLGILGILIMFLSSSLIINTLNALLSQHRRQIGVMKLVGARGRNIFSMYIALIFLYGLIALFFAVPMAILVGNALPQMLGMMISIEIQGFRLVPSAVIVQFFLAFAISMFAGYFPVRRGAKMTVRRAISEESPTEQKSKTGLIDRLGIWLKWISRPVLLSIRNTFRRKSRLALTLFTLIMAGAIFIAVFNVRGSLNSFTDMLSQHQLADVMVTFKEPYRSVLVERDIYQNPGVEKVESWGTAAAEIVDENGSLLTNASIVGPPNDTELLETDIIAGRWLEPEDEQVLVVSDTIYDVIPDFTVGDKLLLDLPGRRTEEWPVAGIFRFADLGGDILGYVNYDTLSQKTNTTGKATNYRVVAHNASLDEQLELSNELDQYLRERGYKISNIEAGNVTRQQQGRAMNILVVFLMTMAILTAVVGSIGLMGTMGMNVLERTREIGVMRAIGAVDTAIMKSVVIEGIMIGFISWIGAVLLSFPFSYILVTTMSRAMLGTIMPLSITPGGFVIWLVVVIVLSTISSIWPARNAARLTIREVLAYE